MKILLIICQLSIDYIYLHLRVLVLLLLPRLLLRQLLAVGFVSTDGYGC